MSENIILPNDLKKYFEKLSKEPRYIYLDPGIRHVRLAVYSDEFLEYIFIQLTYVITEDSRFLS